MNLKQLKTSLTRYPPDMNDIEVMLAYNAGTQEYEPLVLVALPDQPGLPPAVFLGGLSISDEPRPPMQLIELKNALNQLPEDMQEAEVFGIYKTAQRQIEPIVFLAVPKNVDELPFVVVGTLSAVPPEHRK